MLNKHQFKYLYDKIYIIGYYYYDFIRVQNSRNKISERLHIVEDTSFLRGEFVVGPSGT